jgi:PAS domain S-box-containing protein
MGWLSGGPYWLFCSAILASVLLGLKVALLALFLNAGLILIIGWLVTQGILGSSHLFFSTLERGIAAGANFLFVNAVAAVSVAVLVKGLEKTAHIKDQALALVQKEKGHLFNARKYLSHEIEERKVTEKALRESERRYRILAENVSDVIWTIDIDLKFTYVSPSIAALIGYSVDEYLGTHLRDALSAESKIIAEDLITEVLTKLERRKAKPFDLPPMEFEMVHKDGTLVFVEVKSSFLVNLNGDVNGLIGVTRDITKRKEFEKALQRSEMKYRNILESINEGYYEVDLKGDFTFTNRALSEIFGYTNGELLGMNHRGYTSRPTANRLHNILSGIVSYPELLLLDLPEASPLREPITTIQESGKKAAAIVQDLLTLARRGVSVSEIVNLNDVIDEYLVSPTPSKKLVRP